MIPSMPRILNSVNLLYVIMALPSYGLLFGLINGDRYYVEMMYTSGVYAIYLLVFSLAITPLSYLLKPLKSGKSLGRWLLARRRYFGLGSFYYLCLHLIYYIRQVNDALNVFYESLDLPLTVAWGAFGIFLMLALTSNNQSVRKLGKAWKPLHRLAYLGAILSIWHWLLFAFFPQTALTWLGILAATKAAHLGIYLRRKKI